MCSPGCLNRCSFLIHTLHRLMHIPTKMRAVKIEFDLESGEQQENGITFERLREDCMWHGEVRYQERSRLQCFSLSEALLYQSGECWILACVRHTCQYLCPLKGQTVHFEGLAWGEHLGLFSLVTNGDGCISLGYSCEQCVQHKGWHNGKAPLVQTHAPITNCCGRFPYTRMTNRLSIHLSWNRCFQKSVLGLYQLKIRMPLRQQRHC